METKEDRILSAAFRLFNQHGFRKVTMSDVADAAEMSRPSLYAAFPNKSAVFEAIAERHKDRVDAATGPALAQSATVAARLEALFTLWIIEPFESVASSPAGLDLLGNAATYAPVAIAATYATFEAHLAAVLAPALAKKRRGLTARDLAHIMTLATKGLKATSASVAELRRLTDGLIAMAVAAAT